MTVEAVEPTRLHARETSGGKGISNKLYVPNHSQVRTVIRPGNVSLIWATRHQLPEAIPFFREIVHEAEPSSRTRPSAIINGRAREPREVSGTRLVDNVLTEAKHSPELVSKLDIHLVAKDLGTVGLSYEHIEDRPGAHYPGDPDTAISFSAADLEHPDLQALFEALTPPELRDCYDELITKSRIDLATVALETSY